MPTLSTFKVPKGPAAAQGQTGGITGQPWSPPMGFGLDATGSTGGAQGNFGGSPPTQGMTGGQAWTPPTGFGLNAQGAAPGQTQPNAAQGFGTNRVAQAGPQGNQWSQWLQTFQRNPALANQMLNKDVGFFMGNKNAIEDAVGGDLGAWRNSLDSASSNQTQITDPNDVAALSAWGSGGGMSGSGSGFAPLGPNAGGQQPMTTRPGTGGMDPQVGSGGPGMGGIWQQNPHYSLGSAPRTTGGRDPGMIGLGGAYPQKTSNPYHDSSSPLYGMQDPNAPGAMTNSMGGGMGNMPMNGAGSQEQMRAMADQQMAQLRGTGGRDPTAMVGGNMGAIGGQGNVGSFAPAGTSANTTLGALGGGGGYALDVNKFMDPAMGFRIKEATGAVENSAAARGGLLSGSTLQGVSDRANSIAGDEYGRATERAFRDRDFGYGVDRNDRDFAYGAQRDDRNFNMDRDRYNNDFQYRAAVDARNFDFDRDRSNRDFSYGAQRDDRNFEYGAQRDDRNFNRDSYRDDRNFDYGAERDDRDFNYRRLSDISRMGLDATGQDAGLQRLLAQLLSENTIASGQAGASGTVGGARGINATITELIRQLGGG